MMTLSAERPFSLLTFAPMVDSELARFVLSHYGITYREQPHVFAWGSVLALWHGFTPRVPLLYGNGVRLAGPRPMVDWFDAYCPREKMLVPPRQPFRTQIEADWNLFNGELALHTAVLAYFHLLPHPEILVEPFFSGVPKGERFFLGRSYPILRAMFTILLQLGAMKADDALRQIKTIFNDTDRRIADGRRYLVGDTVTLSDLSLAAAAAPLLLPAGYRAPMPPLASMPARMKEIIAELRQHPTANFIAKIYRTKSPTAS
jgi:glutathione S-transferase